jgi:hypothetical protein
MENSAQFFMKKLFFFLEKKARNYESLVDAGEHG